MTSYADTARRSAPVGPAHRRLPPTDRYSSTRTTRDHQFAHPAASHRLPLTRERPAVVSRMRAARRHARRSGHLPVRRRRPAPWIPRPRDRQLRGAVGRRARPGRRPWADGAVDDETLHVEDRVDAPKSLQRNADARLTTDVLVDGENRCAGAAPARVVQLADGSSVLGTTGEPVVRPMVPNRAAFRVEGC